VTWEIRARRYVVGVSGSLGSLAALHQAVGEARHHGIELLMILAWEPPGGDPACLRAPCPPLLADLRRKAEERIWAARDAAFAGGPVPCGVTTARGPAGKVLVAAADRPGDVLVVGAGRRGKWNRLRPSVTRYCLAHATCPVLAVPPSPLQRDLSVWRRRTTFRRPVPRFDR